MSQLVSHETTGGLLVTVYDDEPDSYTVQMYDGNELVREEVCLDLPSLLSTLLELWG